VINFDNRIKHKYYGIVPVGLGQEITI